ncbi:ribokinase [Roseibium marinum]|uniref:Ribokinase n=1 Tax=Roseibium marinum TaxID=281252 RepID=A0A2S3V437_9HYPH|nr:ribokinase [Roseibium marinum]POF34429.1 ribokinase [Roseibium marinum]
MITVFGSINLDLVVSVPRLPKAGETVSGPDHQSFAGGKGANQALAACRAGAAVKMVGAVGRDDFAGPALANLREAGIDLSDVRELDGATGLALIGIDPSGENQIIVASGTNARVKADWLEGCLTDGHILMLQGEAPYEEIMRAMGLARGAGASVFWNPAPVPSCDPGAGLEAVNTLVVNESEAAQLAGRLGIAGGAETFLDSVVGPARTVVVTLGSDGVVAAKGKDRFRFASPSVEAVDTTGAGDAFCGALAAALDLGLPFERALREGVAAGALACTVTGAQSSAPMKADIARLADQIV